MKRTAVILLIFCTSCSIFDKSDYVEARKPRLHKTWPKKHAWHKKIKVWKFTIQQPERGGVRKLKMKS